MKHKKKLDKYIKENLKKGYSLAQIEKAFITYGYEPDFTENFIRKYIRKNIIIKASPLLLGLLLLITAIFFYNPSITTLAIITKHNNFTDNIGLSFNENTEYIWDIENKGILKSVSLDGEVKINGSVKVYLEHENKSYLIFNNKKLEEAGLQRITGLAIEIDNIKFETEGNIT